MSSKPQISPMTERESRVVEVVKESLADESQATATPTVFTVPELGWKVTDTLQGACFEFADGRHDWPSPRERQIIEAFQSYVTKQTASFDVLRDALQAVLTNERDYDGRLTTETVDKVRAALKLTGEDEISDEQREQEEVEDGLRCHNCGSKEAGNCFYCKDGF